MAEELARQIFVEAGLLRWRIVSILWIRVNSSIKWRAASAKLAASCPR